MTAMHLLATMSGRSIPFEENYLNRKANVFNECKNSALGLNTNSTYFNQARSYFPETTFSSRTSPLLRDSTRTKTSKQALEKSSNCDVTSAVCDSTETASSKSYLKYFNSQAGAGIDRKTAYINVETHYNQQASQRNRLASGDLPSAMKSIFEEMIIQDDEPLSAIRTPAHANAFSFSKSEVSAAPDYEKSFKIVEDDTQSVASDSSDESSEEDDDSLESSEEDDDDEEDGRNNSNSWILSDFLSVDKTNLDIAESAKEKKERNKQSFLLEGSQQTSHANKETKHNQRNGISASPLERKNNNGSFSPTKLHSISAKEKGTENGFATRDISTTISRDHRHASAALGFSERPTFSSSRSNTSVAETRYGPEYNHNVDQSASPVSLNTVTSIRTNQSRSSPSTSHSFHKQAVSNGRFGKRTNQLHNIPNKDMAIVNKKGNKSLPVSQVSNNNENERVEAVKSCFDSASDNDDLESLSVEINERTEKRVHNNTQLVNQGYSKNYFKSTTDPEFLSKSKTLSSRESNISLKNKGNHWKNNKKLISNKKTIDPMPHTPRNTSHRTSAPATFSSAQEGSVGNSTNRSFPPLWVKLPLKVARKRKLARLCVETPAASTGSRENELEYSTSDSIEIKETATHEVQIYSNSAVTKTVHAEAQFQVSNVKFRKRKTCDDSSRIPSKNGRFCEEQKKEKRKRRKLGQQMNKTAFQEYQSSVMETKHPGHDNKTQQLSVNLDPTQSCGAIGQQEPSYHNFTLTTCNGRPTATKFPEPDSSLPEYEIRFKTSEEFLREGRRLKQEGDSYTGSNTRLYKSQIALCRALNFFEAAICYTMYGYLLEVERKADWNECYKSPSPSSIYLYTIQLLDFVLKMKSAAGCDETQAFRCLHAACLKSQALLYLGIYKLKRDAIGSGMDSITEQFKMIGSKSTLSPKNSAVSAQQCPISPVVPSPYGSNVPGPSPNSLQASNLTKANSPSTYHHSMIPSKIYETCRQFYGITEALLHAHEKWDVAKQAQTELSKFFQSVNLLRGQQLKLTDSLKELAVYNKIVLAQLRMSITMPC